MNKTYSTKKIKPRVQIHWHNIENTLKRRNAMKQKSYDSSQKNRRLDTKKAINLSLKWENRIDRGEIGEDFWRGK